MLVTVLSMLLVVAVVYLILARMERYRLYRTIQSKEQIIEALEYDLKSVSDLARRYMGVVDRIFPDGVYQPTLKEKIEDLIRQAGGK